MTNSGAKLAKKLQSISIGVVCYLFLSILLLGWPVTILSLLFGSRSVKICFAVYLVYIYHSDTHRCGGQSWNWARTMRNWPIWKHAVDYLPIKLIKTADLDPTRNHVLCGFPHGLFGFGFGGSFFTNGNGCDELFPGLEFRPLTLNGFFFVPLFRELVFSFGGCSCSRESIEYLLSTKPRIHGKQGRALVLLPGGASESHNTRPGEYRVVVRSRKGFVKVALRSGASLVPVFSFGETAIYKFELPPEGSSGAKLRDFVISKLGLPLNPVGEGGYFRNFYNIKPDRSPLHVVVGSPIKLPVIEDPSQEEVDKYHRIFMDKLVELFDSYKDTYSQAVNCGDLTLNLV